MSRAMVTKQWHLIDKGDVDCYCDFAIDLHYFIGHRVNASGNMIVWSRDCLSAKRQEGCDTREPAKNGITLHAC
jgi:hypothetical protein